MYIIFTYIYCAGGACGACGAAGAAAAGGGCGGRRAPAAAVVQAGGAAPHTAHETLYSTTLLTFFYHKLRLPLHFNLDKFSIFDLFYFFITSFLNKT